MVTKGVMTVRSSNSTNPGSKKAVLFYHNLPLSFSEYAFYHIGADYIALCEEADNACVLCRILGKTEIPMFRKAMHRLIIQEPNASLTEHHVVIIKRDLHNLKEVDVIMRKYGKDKESYRNMSVFEY